jgi:hypothetical protein
MSTDIPLTVVYQRVEDIVPDQRSVVVNSINDDSISISNEKTSEKSSEEKSERKELFYKLVTVLGILITIFGIIWFIVTIAVTLKVYKNYKQCFHSKHYVMKETAFKETDIHRIDFNVITGKVNIEFYDEPEVLIRVYDKYRKEDLIDMNTIASQISLEKGFVKITSESPAFNFVSCQHANIEVFIPKKYPKAISFTGFVKTGLVYFHGEHTIPVGTVDIVVEAGYIKVKELNTQALSLSTEIGAIKVRDTISAIGMKLNAHTGSIDTKEIVTKDFIAITKYGRSIHSGIIADNVNVNTNWGYSSVKDILSFEKIQNVNVKTGYGKASLILNNPHLNFTLSSKRGQMELDFEEDNYLCKIFSNSTKLVLNGKCNILQNNAPINRAKISVETDYGVSKLVVEEKEW